MRRAADDVPWSATACWPRLVLYAASIETTLEQARRRKAVAICRSPKALCASHYCGGLVVTICDHLRPLLRRQRRSNIRLINVTPTPVIAGFDRLHDGVPCIAEMIGGVVALGGITATHVAANQAHSQLHPFFSQLQALFAAVSIRLHRSRLIQMRTLG